jgi:hypothetical protein
VTIETYDVYFSGALIKGCEPEEVKQKIGSMFKLEGERLERLFRDKPVAVKRNVNMDKAIKYRVAFRDAGGLVDIVPAGQPAPVPKPPPPARTKTQSAPVETQPEPTTLTLAEGPMEVAAEIPQREISVPDYPLSTADGFDLSDCTAEVEPQVIPDISRLDLTKPGGQLDESPQPKPLQIDTSALDLDTSEGNLDKQAPPQPPVIDTGSLSLSPANQGSLEDSQKPVDAAPSPNLDHLKIIESEESKPEGKAQFKLSDD